MCLSGRISLQMVVWEVPRIKRGLLVASTEPGEDGIWRLKTEGVNIQVIFRNSINVTL